jgi:hypothetical protein
VEAEGRGGKYGVMNLFTLIDDSGKFDLAQG